MWNNKEYMEALLATGKVDFDEKVYVDDVKLVGEVVSNYCSKSNSQKLEYMLEKQIEQYESKKDQELKEKQNNQKEKKIGGNILKMDYEIEMTESFKNSVKDRMKETGSTKEDLDGEVLNSIKRMNNKITIQEYDDNIPNKKQKVNAEKKLQKDRGL